VEAHGHRFCCSLYAPATLTCHVERRQQLDAGSSSSLVQVVDATSSVDADVVLAAGHDTTSGSREAAWEMRASSAAAMAARRHCVTTPTSGGSFAIENTMEPEKQRASLRIFNQFLIGV